MPRQLSYRPQHGPERFRRLARSDSDGQTQRPRVRRFRRERDPVANFGMTEDGHSTLLRGRPAQGGANQPGSLRKHHDGCGIRAGDIHARVQQFREADPRRFLRCFEAGQAGELSLASDPVENPDLWNEAPGGEKVIRRARPIRGEIRRSSGNRQKFAEPAAAIMEIGAERAEAQSEGRFGKSDRAHMFLAIFAAFESRGLAEDPALERCSRRAIEYFERGPAGLDRPRCTDRAHHCGR